MAIRAFHVARASTRVDFVGGVHFGARAARGLLRAYISPTWRTSTSGLRDERCERQGVPIAILCCFLLHPGSLGARFVACKHDVGCIAGDWPLLGCLVLFELALSILWSAVRARVRPQLLLGKALCC